VLLDATAESTTVLLLTASEELLDWSDAVVVELDTAVEVIDEPDDSVVAWFDEVIWVDDESMRLADEEADESSNDDDVIYIGELNCWLDVAPVEPSSVIDDVGDDVDP
jgi:hypothetical protein